MQKVFQSYYKHEVFANVPITSFFKLSKFTVENWFITQRHFTCLMYVYHEKFSLSGLDR